jgi:hypothetical protein
MAWRLADRALDRSAANYFDPLPRVAVAEPGLDRIEEALLDRPDWRVPPKRRSLRLGNQTAWHRIKKKRCLRTITFVQPQGSKLVSPKNYATIALPKGGDTWAARQ